MSVNGGLSKKFLLCQGVPQRSCLGLLLFTIYTHKLFDIVERHLPQVHCYADDRQLYVSFSSNQSAEADAAIKSMTDCIRDVRSWMISDNLTWCKFVGRESKVVELRHKYNPKETHTKKSRERG